tara:strand:- start:84 stop:740 length:657 start_codon:yes stop_codon:yes gene_type:complete
MKIFLDTADVPTIVKHYGTGLIDGITTNPTLILKSGRQPHDVYRELQGHGIPDISMEIVTDEAAVFIAEGRTLKEQFGDCTTIKVPCTVEGLKACKTLSEEGIRVNVTLIFSATQAILAAKAGATYVSPFVGRVEDNSFDGPKLIQEIVNLYREHMVRTEVLAASLRDAHSVAKCYEYGADIVTMPPAVFEKMYNHILTDKGLELFQKDYEGVIGRSA